ncbi:hypothetical protein MSG28_006517 [Choristoneura fumiferana]|uniref:Uncharacterized protein n=1 Tax=Choristoneura fumiferana TaxID=7141 RepID=A0ACC0JF77_CHOFU|nr:hypothetical protein MSG28_006517 [Choristoneura fumiferana]
MNDALVLLAYLFGLCLRALSLLTGFAVRARSGGGSWLGYVSRSDPRGALPAWLVNRVTAQLAPRLVQQLHAAARRYPGWKALTDYPHHKPWRHPEQVPAYRISLEDAYPKPVPAYRISLEDVSYQDLVENMVVHVAKCNPARRRLTISTTIPSPIQNRCPPTGSRSKTISLEDVSYQDLVKHMVVHVAKCNPARRR